MWISSQSLEVLSELLSFKLVPLFGDKSSSLVGIKLLALAAATSQTGYVSKFPADIVHHMLERKGKKLLRILVCPFISTFLWLGIEKCFSVDCLYSKMLVCLLSASSSDLVQELCMRGIKLSP